MYCVMVHSAHAAQIDSSRAAVSQASRPRASDPGRHGVKRILWCLFYTYQRYMGAHVSSQKHYAGLEGRDLATHGR